jgi:hypothetical protein
VTAETPAFHHASLEFEDRHWEIPKMVAEHGYWGYEIDFALAAIL